MSSLKLTLPLAAVICFAACSAVSRPETKLLGKWQTSDEKPPSKKVTHELYFEDQYEFFADGSVAKMQKERRSTERRWEQAGTGTFKFVDPTHIKIDLEWYYGTTIYELTWLDNNHINLRAGDDVVQLGRVK